MKNKIFKRLLYIFNYTIEQVREKLGDPISVEPLNMGKTDNGPKWSSSFVANSILGYTLLNHSGRIWTGKETYKDAEFIYVDGHVFVDEDNWERINDLFPRIVTKTKIHHNPNRLLVTPTMNRILDELIINRIKLVDTFEKLEVPCRQGLALYGPPGTGKTTIAGMLHHVFEDNKDVNFEILSSKNVAHPNFSFEGVLENMKAKCKILFLEDADAYASARKEGENNPRVGELLNVLDGVVDYGNIFIIIATNYLDRIDKALLRRGRVDVQIEIPPIDDKSLIPVIARKQHPNIVFKDDDLISRISMPTTPADIIAIIRDAASNAIFDECINREGKLVVSDKHFRNYERYDNVKKKCVGFGV